MRTHETSVQVRYAETDQMGVAYYSNYLVWMEVGRVEYCKAAGFRYRDMEAEDGVLLAVVEARCRYHSPARYDDEVRIRTWVEAASPRMVTFGYEMPAVSELRDQCSFRKARKRGVGAYCGRVSEGDHFQGRDLLLRMTGWSA